jgi:hypothetical protein
VPRFVAQRVSFKASYIRLIHIFIGKLSDLSSCKVGETVFHPGSANPYLWPSPIVSSAVNPTAIYGSGSSGGTDRNSPPTSFSRPYTTDSFTATQRLQFCNGNVQTTTTGNIRTLYLIYQSCAECSWTLTISGNIKSQNPEQPTPSCSPDPQHLRLAKKGL